MANELTNFDAAKRALDLAVKVDDVKDFRDKAIAIRHYARQSKDKELEKDALTLRLRAERRLGQLLRQVPKATGGDRAGRGRPLPPPLLKNDASIAPVSKTGPILPPTMAERGIDENLLRRAYALGRMSEGEFEEHIQDARKRLTISARKDRDPMSLLEPKDLPEIPLIRSSLSLVERLLYKYPSEEVSLLKSACLKMIEAIDSHQTQRRVVCLER